MPSLTATIFKGLSGDLSDDELSDTNAERIIDLAIAEVTLRSGEDLPLMGGTAGTKTVSLTTQQYAVVLGVARAIYNGYYKNPETSVVGGISITHADLLSNPTVDQAIERAARRLAEWDVGYG